jgi:hypothetical protein
MVAGTIVNGYLVRDGKLYTAARDAVDVYIKNMGPGPNSNYVQLKVNLKLYLVLYEAYQCVWLTSRDFPSELILHSTGNTTFK